MATKNRSKTKAPSVPNLRSLEPAEGSYLNRKVKQRILDDICGYLADGASLRKACSVVRGSPTPAYVLRWLDADDEMRKQYESVRNIAYRRLADELLEIADDTQGDRIIDAETGAVTVVSEAPIRSRLRVETRKWILSKMLPKMYGDRVTNVLEGSVDVALSIDQVRDELKRMLGGH